MSFWKVDARGPQFFPEKTNCVQPEPRNTFLKIFVNNFQELQQNHWIFKIEVNLIVAERAPNQNLSKIRTGGPKKF